MGRGQESALVPHGNETSSAEYGERENQSRPMAEVEARRQHLPGQQVQGPRGGGGTVCMLEGGLRKVAREAAAFWVFWVLVHESYCFPGTRNPLLEPSEG